MAGVEKVVYASPKWRTIRLTTKTWKKLHMAKTLLNLRNLDEAIDYLFTALDLYVLLPKLIAVADQLTDALGRGDLEKAKELKQEFSKLLEECGKHADRMDDLIKWWSTLRGE